MPNLADNNTQIPAARVKMNDDSTGFVNRPWYRWFFNTYIALEAGRRYGSFYDTTTQTATTANTAYAMTYNNTFLRADGSDLIYGVYLGTDTSQVYVDNTATYNFQFSAQLTNTSGGAHTISIWPRINGVDVDYSATQVLVSGGSSAAVVAAWNFVLNLQRNDYFQLMWSTTDTSAKLVSVAASSPVPAIPSVILTVTSCVGV
jgi:hypothetical protein